jgi:hypothetical protein
MGKASQRRMSKEHCCDAFDNQHLFTALQVHGDFRIGRQVRRRNRAGAEREALVEPNTPHWPAMWATVRLA